MRSTMPRRTLNRPPNQSTSDHGQRCGAAHGFWNQLLELLNDETAGLPDSLCGSPEDQDPDVLVKPELDQL
jgi:hypothetical protein